MKSIIIHIPSLKRDITYYVGSCAEDNDDVIDNASPDDFWFHVANKKSCHVSASVLKVRFCVNKIHIPLKKK